MLTDRQLDYLQHSLGVDQYGRGQMYRNYFCAGEEDDPTCRELAELGLMRQVASTVIFPGFNYRVTEEGKRAVLAESPKPPKVSRSRQRYLRFLRADLGCTFKEWLLHEREWTRESA